MALEKKDKEWIWAFIIALIIFGIYLIKGRSDSQQAHEPSYSTADMNECRNECAKQFQRGSDDFNTCVGGCLVITKQKQ